MLIRFSAKNYRSLLDQQELSLVASSLKEEGRKVVSVKRGKFGLLSVAALYGGNASGKTNTLRALNFFRSAVKNSHSRWLELDELPYRPFALDKTAKKRPSSFDAEILLDGIRYNFGFSLNSKEILQEWLYAYPKGKRQLWYRRDKRRAPNFVFGKNLTGENKRIEKLTRPTSLFISTAAQNNHPLLAPIYDWFSKKISFLTPVQGYPPLIKMAELVSDKKKKSTILNILKSADLGILDVNLKYHEADNKVVEFTSSLRKVFKSYLGHELEFQLPEEGAPEITLRHSGRKGYSADISFFHESSGTIALLGLLGPIILALDSANTLLVDELESSMHPLLAQKVVQLFNSPNSNPKGAQLIFSTHSTNLLRGAVLRRDQIWFAEKDIEGATHLYPLTDFRPRGTENVERGYLQGRYGALPFLGNFEDLFQKKKRNVR